MPKSRYREFAVLQSITRNHIVFKHIGTFSECAKLRSTDPTLKLARKVFSTANK